MLECPGTGGLEEGGQRRSTRIEAKEGKETFLTERGVRVHTLPSTQGRPRGSQAPLHPSSSVPGRLPVDSDFTRRSDHRNVYRDGAQVEREGGSDFLIVHQVWYIFCHLILV